MITIEKIENETAKAILAQVEVESAAGRRGVKVWCPKSQITVDGDRIEAPEWLRTAKLKDMFGNNAGAFWFN